MTANGQPIHDRFIYGPHVHTLAVSMIATALDSPDPNLVEDEVGKPRKLPVGTRGFSDLDRLVSHAAAEGVQADDLIKALAWEAALLAHGALARVGTPSAAIEGAVRSWAQQTAALAALKVEDGDHA